MKQKRKMHSANGLFGLIDGILEEKGLKPDILDYGLGGDAHEMILSEEFTAVPKVRYGASEGIYLDIDLENIPDYGHGHKKGSICLGTYKTLGISREDYFKMLHLGGEFYFALAGYVRDHMDEFNWTGFDISLSRGGNLSRCMWVTTHERAVERVKRLLSMDNSVEYAEIRDNAADKTERIHRDAA